MKTLIKALRLVFIGFSATLIGCACVDPLEPVNREIFKFNMLLDCAVFRPVAKAYDKVVPPVMACHIGNFFDNIDDLTNIANNTLQFKLLDAWSDCWRFAFNTTFGLLGLFDVATCAGLPKHHQDFGLTLARYGFVNSTYLMIPFFGPSTIRDTIGWTVDWRYLSIWPYIEPPSLRYGLYGLRLVHKRAGLLAADQLIDDALDPYIFLRDAYLQKRECEIKSICPPCDSKESTDAGPKDASDPFISDGEDRPGSSDPNDTFVDGDGPQSTPQKENNDTFVADDDEKNPIGKTKEGKKSKVTRDDPFIP